MLLDLSPARPGLHTDGPRQRIELEDAVEAPHVDVERTLGGNLAAHAVAGTTNRDRAGVVRDGLDNLLRRRRRQHLGHADGIEARDVVDDAGRVDGGLGLADDRERAQGERTRSERQDQRTERACPVSHEKPSVV